MPNIICGKILEGLLSCPVCLHHRFYIKVRHERAHNILSIIILSKFSVSNGVQCTEFREPHGVCASIVPFNFPMMVPMWTMPIAIACGNTYILKPSEKVPLTMSKFAEYIAQSGLPKGVFQIVHGGATAVNSLIDHPDTAAITFVGSTKIAKMVYNRCKALEIPKRCLCLGGAKNHLVAVKDCNVDMTSTDIVNSFCGCAGLSHHVKSLCEVILALH